ncbi:hypothetical protein WJ84_02285 [Burkholderia ubonensis]|nr:hypothetical protein WJ84_02285 [Burkholderia ubonensis]
MAFGVADLTGVDRFRLTYSTTKHGDQVAAMSSHKPGMASMLLSEFFSLGEHSVNCHMVQIELVIAVDAMLPGRRVAIGDEPGDVETAFRQLGERRRHFFCRIKDSPVLPDGTIGGPLQFERNRLERQQAPGPTVLQVPLKKELLAAYRLGFGHDLLLFKKIVHLPYSANKKTPCTRHGV